MITKSSRRMERIEARGAHHVELPSTRRRGWSVTKRTGARVVQGLALSAAAIALLPLDGVRNAEHDLLGPVGGHMPAEVHAAHHVRHLLRQERKVGHRRSRLSDRHGPDDGHSSGGQDPGRGRLRSPAPDSDPTPGFRELQAVHAGGVDVQGISCHRRRDVHVGSNKPTATQIGTDYDILYGMVQKSLPFGGYIAGGGYYGLGSDILFTNETGAEAKGGSFSDWSSPDIKLASKGSRRSTSSPTFRPARTLRRGRCRRRALLQRLHRSHRRSGVLSRQRTAAGGAFICGRRSSTWTSRSASRSRRRRRRLIPSKRLAGRVAASAVTRPAGRSFRPPLQVC